MTDAGQFFPPASPSSAPRPPLGPRPVSRLEWATVFHLVTLTLLATWAFGGAADWAQRLISGWGSLGALLMLSAVSRGNLPADRTRRVLLWLWPLAALNVLVLSSALNPSFTEMTLGGEPLWVHTGASHAGLPSSANPATSREHLWLFDAIYLSCFNLTLIVRHRRLLRGLLLFVGGNAMVLSIFGTFQKLLSDGLYFGLVKSPNPRFFATFVYGNHWSAYIVLAFAASAGLVFYYARRLGAESIENSPAAMGVIALLLMAITPALAGSRAGVAMVVVLLVAGVAFVWFGNLRRRAAHESSLLPLAGLALFTALAVGGSIYLARDSLRERWSDTNHQLQSHSPDSRLDLYRDTWRLVVAQPVFGWGLGTYGKVFMLIRPRPLEASRQYERSYVEAHSDWLQALAEVGVAGTVLLAFHALLPFRRIQPRHFQDPVVAFALGGCGLVLLYAAVEFPFGNPAVVLTWWTCFFCAVKYARLQDRSAAP